MGGYFEPKPNPTRPIKASALADFAFIFLDSFKPHTRLLLGALVQIALYKLLPPQWAAVPALALLFTSVITTASQLLGPSSLNPFLDSIVPGRATAQIPSFSDGTYGPAPSNKPLVIFNIGIQANHPLGVLAPAVKPIADYFQAMVGDLLRRRDELGVLSVSEWRGNDADSSASLNICFYFRDLEGLHRFAGEALHREAWRYYERVRPAHVGIFHETFCVPAGGWETIYVNCRPVLLGKGLVGGQKGERRTVLVDADTPVLKTQYARLGRTEDGVPVAQTEEATT